ncbi:hypothetical protein [Sphingobacterium sp. BIGb0165]|uniref:hypothetical protein n=1 Tax=Sphingobacterium sp. BIGb0165 TaxID=2940615 RepID=UPI00216A11F4|nr:hypothetical protein [Sphingobacterium sp. BIGb0165]MCS4226421.1 hypothetical protein [Sphingobacterium sp. BIGb0165]
MINRKTKKISQNNNRNDLIFSYRLLSKKHLNKKTLMNTIITVIERYTKKDIDSLKKELKEEELFFLGLRYLTTTKKAYCQALGIPIEAACRYKRTFEKKGLLVQSSYKIVCPYTGHLAHLISTNPVEFDNLKRIKVNQLSLFS